MSSPKAARPSALTVPAAAPVEEHPWAYALIEGPPGQFTAVSLEGVTARAVVKLEPNGEPEASARAMGRLNRAVELRTYHKQWGKP